jgi:dehydrogenase/reductase SDR family protein 1
LCYHTIISVIFPIVDNPDAPEKSKKLFSTGETTEFAGKAVTRLACDDKIMSKTGKILLTSHLSSEYEFKDIDGTTPSDFTSVRYLVGASGHTWLASWIPSFLRVPLFVIHFGSNKF